MFESLELPRAVENDDTEVVFLLCLEPLKESADVSFGERVLNTAIRNCQPSPVLMHVELVVPPTRKKDDMLFSTYIGKRAAWGSSFERQREFYSDMNAGRWRALPVLAPRAARDARMAANREVGTEYSVSSYLLSVPPLRAFAPFFGDGARRPAHCAALSARILSAVTDLKKSPAWFAPSTLFLELSKKTRFLTYDAYLSETEHTLSIPEQEDIDRAYNALIRGTDVECAQLTTAQCNAAIRKQTRIAVQERAKTRDETRMRLAEKALANMLLRFALVSNR